MENQNRIPIDVSEIMESIRKEIKEMGYSSEMLSFADVHNDDTLEMELEQFDADMLHSDVQYLAAHHRLEPYPALGGNAIGNFFRKLVRKLTQKDIAPCLAEQSSLNASMAQAQQQIELYIQESRQHSTKVLLERIEVLELQQKNTRIVMEQMQAQIKTLTEKLSREEQV